ncbi:hypothetical protein [Rathayibacter festucae]|uniref:hypothetical protein n=1 Tax=Rathayibacter festucae TaxID=110937 RepID=UPI002A69AF91|nr:hypothetical protein [Rathayibacter festucae]MDY0911425.1 hypothetical protein [Rathayibacter festucae]
MPLIREAAWAAGAAVISVVAALLALRVSPSDLGQRWQIGGDDQILHYTLFTSATQVFPFANNEALGFPDGFNAFFSAQFDVSSAIAASLLALVIHDGVLLLNVFYLLTFAGVAVTGYAFFRALQVRPWVAALAAIVFSLAPYHFLRIAAGHAFLANYWAIPLIGILLLMVAGPRTDPFHSWRSSAPTRLRRLIRTVVPAAVLGLLVASTGGYYYVFGVIVVGGVWGVATVGRLLARVRLRELILPTVPLLALVVLVGVELVLLGLGYGERYRPYFETRVVAESEFYAGKLVLLLLPWAGSALPKAQGLLARYTTETGVLQTTEPPGFSIIGTVGLLLILGGSLVLLLGAQSGRRGSVGVLAGTPRFRLLATATYWTLAFYAVTGLGVVVSLIAGPTIRAWSRLSIVLLLLCIAAVALALEHLTSRARLRVIAAVVISAVVVVDQLIGVSGAVPLRPSDDAEMRRFVASADALLDDGCGVVQLPLKSFPDSGRIGELSDYDEALPYLVTEDGDLEWSYGSVAGTYGWDVWASVDRPAEFEQAVERTGACAVYVDTAGYTEDPEGWEPFVEAATGSSEPAVSSSSGRWLLYTRP